MASKSQKQDEASTPTAQDFNAFAHLEEAGLGNVMGLGTAWFEALSDMGAEVAGFVAERIKEDVKTQHEILHCKNVADLQHIQGQFIEKALEQYQVETGRLVQMSADAFAPPKSDKTE